MLIVEKKPILLISSSTCLLQRLYSVLVQNNPWPRPLIQGLDILSVPPPSVTSCLSFFSCKSTLFWLADPHKQKVKTVSGSQTELFAWRYWGYQLLLTSYSTKSRKAAGTMTWVRVVTVYMQDMRENEENHNKFPLTFNVSSACTGSLLLRYKSATHSVLPSLSLCFCPGYSEWAVFWLPAPPTHHHQPRAALLPLAWRCLRALGCLQFPQLYPRLGKPLLSSRSQKMLCPIQGRLTSVIGSAKVRGADWKKKCLLEWNVCLLSICLTCVCFLLRGFSFADGRREASC